MGSEELEKILRQMGESYSLPETMIAILKEVKILEDGTVVFSDKARELIHEVAELKRKNAHLIRIVEKNAAARKMYLKGMTAGDIFKDMCLKIVKAPNSIYASASEILLCDIDNLLRAEKME